MIGSDTINLFKTDTGLMGDPRELLGCSIPFDIKLYAQMSESSFVGEIELL